MADQPDDEERQRTEAGCEERDDGELASTKHRRSHEKYDAEVRERLV